MREKLVMNTPYSRVDRMSQTSEQRNRDCQKLGKRDRGPELQIGNDENNNRRLARLVRVFYSDKMSESSKTVQQEGGRQEILDFFLMTTNKHSRAYTRLLVEGNEHEMIIHYLFRESETQHMKVKLNLYNDNYHCHGGT